jgi:hypothetical protein
MSHQTRQLEDAQVLRHSRPADGELGSELADRSRSASQQLEDVPPGGIAERIQRMTVSKHLP